MPTVYKLGLIVGAAVGGGTLASVATHFIRRAEVGTVVALVLATALAAVVTALVLFRTVLAKLRAG